MMILVPRFRRSLVAALVALLAVGLPAGASAAEPGAPVDLPTDPAGDPAAGLISNAGLFVPAIPSRIVDTRVADGAVGPIGPHQTIDVQVTGRGGTPSDGVAAVVANVTVTDPDAAGNIAMYPSGLAAPNVSNLNFVTDQTVANLVTVPVGPDGMISIANNSSGSSQVMMDIEGYYLAGTPTEAGAFASLTPTRIVDTRVGLGSSGKVGAQQTLVVQVAGQGGVPATGVSALVANVTVTEPTEPGNISAYPSGIDQPVVSNLNFIADQTVPNLVTVPVGADGTIVLRNDSLGSSHLIVDVAGYYLAGTPTATGAFVPLTPSRIVDSRIQQGAPGALPAGKTLYVDVTGSGGVPISAVAAVVANVTVTEPTASGNLSAYPSGFAAPSASNLNFVTGQTVPNLAVVSLGTDGNLMIVNNSSGTVQLVVDVSGYFIL